MVVNVGISVSYVLGEFMRCDGVVCQDQKPKTPFTITWADLGGKTDDVAHIIRLFNKIILKINGGELGCIGIHMFCYSNEIRKLYLRSAKTFGFKKAEIIDSRTAMYFNLMQITKCRDNNVTWMFVGMSCYVWQTTKQKTEFVDYLDFEDCSTEEEFLKITKNLKFRKPPNFLFYPSRTMSKLTINPKVVNKIFPSCYLIVATESKHEEAALYKAQLLSLNKIPSTFNVVNNLNFNITIKYDEKELIKLLNVDSLPLKRLVKIKKSKENNLLQIIIDNNEKFEENLPDFDEFMLEFKIDKNSIYSLNYKEIRHKVVFLTDDFVKVFDSKTEDVVKYHTSVDYKFDNPVVGVEYESSPVISDSVKNFGIIPFSTKTTKIFKHNCCTEYYYGLDLNGTECFIAIEEVVTDLLRKANKIFEANYDAIILIIPSFFNHQQTESYKKIAKVAGLSKTYFIEENKALAYYFGNEYLQNENDNFCLIHFSNYVFILSIFKNENGKIMESENVKISAENFLTAKNKFYENIVIEVENSEISEKIKNDYLQAPLRDVLDFVKNIENQKILVTKDILLHAAISSNASDKNIIFIENPEEIIIKMHFFSNSSIIEK